MENFTVEFTNDKTLLIYRHSFSELPWVTQATWPDGTPWESEAEAKNWADILIQATSDPEFPYLPPHGPNQPNQQRTKVDSVTGEPIMPERLAPTNPETGLPIEFEFSKEPEPKA